MLLNNNAPASRRRILIAIFCALGFLGACDSREVTGPAPLATASNGMTSESASSFGSTVLTPTRTSHPVEVANLPFQPVASIHGRTWVVVRAHGSVTMTPIPDCGGAPETPNWVCGVGSAMPEFSSAAPTESGPVQVMANWSTGQARIPLRGAGGGAVGLLRAGAGVTLTGRLNLPGNYWYRVGEDPVPTYTFSGGYTVSAEAIGTPLRVEEGSADANGTREYSVAPLYGLHFVNPLEPYYLAYQPAGAVTWKFIYGRNVADDGSGGIGLSYVTSCSGATVCRYTPSQSGRMVAGAFVEGQFVEMASVVQRVVPPELNLTCNAKVVTRGDDLDCSASAQPSGTLTDVRWTFTDTAGHTIPGPPAVFRWKGQMVVSGTVTVTALLNGSAVTDSDTIVVIPRTWSVIRLRVRQKPYLPGHLPTPAMVVKPGHLGDSHADTLVSLPTKEVLDGPNKGWWFLEREVREFGFVVHINEAAFAVGSDWYKLQTGGDYLLTEPSGTVTLKPNGRCSPSFIPIMRRLTREHEGLGSSPLTSHADAARTYLATQRAHERLERTIAYGPDFSGIGHGFPMFAYARYVDIAVEMERFAAPHTTTPPADGGPGIVDPAPFPCYARPWWP
jgi:hypothetical protein